MLKIEERYESHDHSNTLMLKTTFRLIISLLFAGCALKAQSMPIHSLTVNESFENPTGFHDATPSFSWKLPVDKNIRSQSAYRIVVARSLDALSEGHLIWDSGKVESSQSTWIEYKGAPLRSGQIVYWKATIWDQDGEATEWSAPQKIEMGLLSYEDWKADWIKFTEENPVTRPIAEDSELLLYKVQCFRKEFELSNPQSARIYLSAKGLYEVLINGERVGDHFMAPGWTPYEKRCESVSYDVSSYLKDGRNTIAVQLNHGWYGGRLAWDKKQWLKTRTPEFICQMEVKGADGSETTLTSDKSWKASIDGPIRFSGIYDGEIYDANKVMLGWSEPGYDDSSWLEVETEAIDPEVKLTPKRHKGVIHASTLDTKSISWPESDAPIFDLGQNMVGVPRLRIPVVKGQKVIVRFGEMLNQDGSLHTENYRSALSTNEYIPAKTGYIDWEPTFTFHGFRYVQIRGYDTSEPPESDWIEGRVWHSDFEQIGRFKSSHALLNQLQSNITWGLRGNFLEIPTDCPQRDERLGWTGDAQVILPAAFFNYGTHAFWSAWMESMRYSQFESGGIPWVVPDVLGNNNHSTGWGDAAIIIPWEIYQRTGDTTILEENYEMMEKLLSFYKNEAEDNVVKVFSFSDWLQPFPHETTERKRFADTPKNLIGTAYYAHDLDYFVQVNRALGKEEAAKEYEALLDQVKATFQKQFFDESGKLTTRLETQTGYLLALGFDLLTEEQAPKAFEHLVEQVNLADNHLRTGFLGTPLLPFVLDKFGRSELSYEILLKDTYPSWFYSIHQGATTMWERWNSYTHKDGFNSDGMNSFNHYAYGAIGQWMYERIAGLALDPEQPGYKHFYIQPIPHEEQSFAEAELETPYGIAKSGWLRVGDHLQIEATVPPNSTATLRFPKSEKTEVLDPGTHTRLVHDFFKE